VARRWLRPLQAVFLDESGWIETGFRESVPALKCAGTAQAGTSARQVLAGDSN
jgi:hypothetical protein